MAVGQIRNGRLKEREDSMRFKHQKADNRYVKAQNSVDFKKFVKRSFTTLVAVVVFVTAYALILPAKTETVPDCGFEEHTHQAECYLANRTLSCEDITEEHIHTDECYTEEEALRCETEVHVHNEDCYQEAETVADETEAVEESTAVEETTQPEVMQIDVSQYVDFEEYVKKHNGYIRSSLYDSEGNYINHIYEASGAGYTYTLNIYSKEVETNTYIYYLPEGMTVEVASRIGDISNGDSSIGTYRISDDCSYILFNFYKQSTTVQDIRGKITLSVSFKELAEPAIEKKGYYISEDGVIDGFFHFEVNAVIPASGEGIPKREWKIVDHSEVTGSPMWTYDFDNEREDDDLIVTISYDDVENQEIFNLKEVYNSKNQHIAYFVDRVTKNLYLVNRCNCVNDKESCLNFKEDTGCAGLNSFNLSDAEKRNYKEWCACWSFDKDVKLTMKYKNAINGADGSQILSNQNALKSSENQYKNSVYLTGRYKQDGEIITKTQKSSSEIYYSNMLDKKETQDESVTSGYESVFTVVINPDKADFSKIDADNDDQYDKKVIVLDTMNNLKYIPGSIKIVAEDTDGNVIELEHEKDYNFECENLDSGNRFEIELLTLGRYKYTITYRTSIFNENQNSNVQIVNNVSLGLYGNIYGYSEPTYRFVKNVDYYDEWDYLRYMINILKVDFYDNEIYLPNAEFGLYSEDGYQIATAVTDDKGSCLFQTDVEKGVIFRTNSMYYIQEITAPSGYELDTKKYWFYFGKKQNTEMEAEMNKEYPGINISYVPLSPNKEYVLNMEITNEKLFVLPETGGNSVNGFIIAGVIVMAISLSCIIIKTKTKKQSLRHSHSG